jgi:hypothetical protein
MLRSGAARISARVELALLGDPGGACLVVQRRPCESWYRVAAHCRSQEAGRRWIEAHYVEVRWRSPVACTALVGKMRMAPH